jgi:oligopeptide/dipeptide ABC transporter ATP-binding protein
MNDYPYQFSGGMRQRVMIALALAANPILLLADEPTTALDVTIQAQILELIQNLKSEFNTSVLLITHDLGVAAGICDEVAVIYAGQIVEKASVDELFSEPRMPYTRGLLDSLPSLQTIQGELLPTIEGLPPTGLEDLDQCRFSPRCRWSTNSCTHSEPVLSIRSASHYARCFGTEQDGWINEL